MSSRSSCSRRMATSATLARPMASRSAVWAASSTARVKSPTSMHAAFASHTCQNSTAFTSSGTRSAVRVSSAPKVVARTRVSTRMVFCSMTGNVQNRPGPDTRLNVPKRSTTTFSHCCAMCTAAVARSAQTSAVEMAATPMPAIAHQAPSARPNASRNTTAENSSTPVLDARSPTISVLASGTTCSPRRDDAADGTPPCPPGISPSFRLVFTRITLPSAPCAPSFPRRPARSAPSPRPARAGVRGPRPS